MSAMGRVPPDGFCLAGVESGQPGSYPPPLGIVRLKMTPEEAEQMIPRDERDVLIDQYAFDPSDDYSRLPEPGRVTLEIRSLDYCQAIQDMAFDVLDRSKSEFMAAVGGARSSEALSASYKVVAMRELLRQLLPIRNGPKSH